MQKLCYQVTKKFIRIEKQSTRSTSALKRVVSAAKQIFLLSSQFIVLFVSTKTDNNIFTTITTFGICLLYTCTQRTLKPEDDYVLPHQRIWMFDILVCPLPVTERFLSQPLDCGTVFNRTLLLPHLHLLNLMSS